MHFNPDKCHPTHWQTQLNYIFIPSWPKYIISRGLVSLFRSNNLRWDRHVTVISTKATQTLNFVCQNIYRCIPEAKELAYTSLVHPLMEFAAPAVKVVPSEKRVTFRGIVVPECGGALFRQIFLSRNSAPANIVYHRRNADTAPFRQISPGRGPVYYDLPKC